MFHNDGNIVLIMYRKHIDFIKLVHLDFNSIGLSKILSIEGFSVDFLVIFLVDSLMWLYIIPISTKKIKIFLIRINYNIFTTKFLSINFSVSISLFFSNCMSFLTNFSLLIYAQENANQFLFLKHNNLREFLLSEVFSLFFLSNGSSLVIIISCWLNPDLNLNLTAVVAIQYTIINELRSLGMYKPFVPGSNYFWFHLFCSVLFEFFCNSQY